MTYNMFSGTLNLTQSVRTDSVGASGIASTRGKNHVGAKQAPMEICLGFASFSLEAPIQVFLELL